MFSNWFTNANNRCGKLELTSMECMEYYGFKKGKIICKDHYEDFMECRFKRLEVGTTNKASYEYTYGLLTMKMLSKGVLLNLG